MHGPEGQEEDSFNIAANDLRDDRGLRWRSGYRRHLIDPEMIGLTALRQECPQQDYQAALAALTRIAESGVAELIERYASESFAYPRRTSSDSRLARRWPARGRALRRTSYGDVERPGVCEFWRATAASCSTDKRTGASGTLRRSEPGALTERWVHGPRSRALAHLGMCPAPRLRKTATCCAARPVGSISRWR